MPRSARAGKGGEQSAGLWLVDSGDGRGESGDGELAVHCPFLYLTSAVPNWPMCRCVLLTNVCQDQLDDAFICGLRDPLRRVGEQRQYMTRGWCLLIRRDVQRYLQCELPGVDAGGGDLCSSWLDDGAVAEAYPALQELCEQLRCLPHEINSKTRAVLGLLQPLAETSAGATATRALSVLLSLVPRGCGREERVDARVGDGDWGIRLSCSYYIELDGDGDGASAVTTMICKAAEGGGESFEVGVFDDLLLCHGSAALRYFCSPAERAYCVLQVFVHGCDA